MGAEGVGGIGGSSLDDDGFRCRDGLSQLRFGPYVMKFPTQMPEAGQQFCLGSDFGK